jgi:excisionase family DNA binding protein
MDALLTLDEAASRLGVSRRRAQAMVTSGLLPAERRGLQWFVAAQALELVDHNRGPGGRPLSSARAWAAIAEPAAGGDEVDTWRRKVRPRARHRSYYIHPGLLDRLRHRPEVVLGGLDAAAAAGVPVDLAALDVYVRAGDAAGIFEELRAREAAVDPNVFAHIVPDEAWPFGPGQHVTGDWVAWLDLEDRRHRGANALFDRLVGGRARA